ncbi:DoxX family protein [Aneurinibacillus uraniidurans]|nr:DoxX family protein [Aneurinibacillus sp. B1]WCN37658.1 DoxX family protein [Aneurinibacillus sp. B1]
MNMVTLIIQMILVIMFTFSAAIKFLRTKTMVQHWNEYRYPFWFMYVVATLETIGVIGILAGFWYSELLKYAAALISVLMLGAIHAHLFRAKHNPYMAINAFLMLGLSILLIMM